MKVVYNHESQNNCVQVSCVGAKLKSLTLDVRQNSFGTTQRAKGKAN